jgi:hypothetical protein
MTKVMGVHAGRHISIQPQGHTSKYNGRQMAKHLPDGILYLTKPIKNKVFQYERKINMNQLFEIPGFNIYLQIAVTFLVIGGHLLHSRGKPEEGFWTVITLSVVSVAGWFTITNAIFGHILYADQVAESIGWATGSGFQTELAFALIGIGLVGALGTWRRDFWLPFVIAKSTMSLGAGLVHVSDILQHQNFAPSNAGPVLYWDFLFPLTLIVIYTLYRRSQETKMPNSQVAYQS